MELQTDMRQALMGDMEFAEKIRLLMGRERLSQADLAAAVGTHQPQVTKWLTSGVRPSLPFALRLARALRVSLDYLMDDTLEEPSGDLSDDERQILEIARVVGYETAIRRLTVAPEPRPIEQEKPPAAGGKPRNGRMRGA
jgi:transcriptional regulator with XRE-family HTH domain